MSRIKAYRQALKTPYMEGIHKDTFFAGEKLVVFTSLTAKQEALARVSCSATETAARVAGVILSPNDLEAQEKWERILLLTEGVIL